MDDFNQKSISMLLLASILGGVVGGGAVMVFGNSQQFKTNDVKTIEEKIKVIEDDSITDVVEQAKQSVVSIVISKEVPIYSSTGDVFGFGGFENFFYPRLKKPEVKDTVKQKIGGGSGFIITTDGLIVTNRHVVADEEAEYSVILNDGSEYEAKVIDRDTVNDIAFVKIEA